MADDITIEEHDILSNPMLKEIFTDISKVKQEVIDFEAESKIKIEPDIKEDVDIPIEEPEIRVLPQIVPKLEFNLENLVEEEIDIKHELLNSPLSPVADFQFNFSNTNSCNIVLSHIRDVKKRNEEIAKIYSSKVSLENCFLKLVKDESFCVLCKILFSSKVKFERHFNDVHLPSDVACIDDVCDTAVDKMVLLHREYMTNSKSRNKKRKKNPDEILCDHCNIYFPSKDHLIEHLNNLLNPKLFACSQCGEKFSNKTDLVLHEKPCRKILKTKRLTDSCNRTNRSSIDEVFEVSNEEIEPKESQNRNLTRKRKNITLNEETNFSDDSDDYVPELDTDDDDEYIPDSNIIDLDENIDDSDTTDPIEQDKNIACRVVKSMLQDIIKPEEIISYSDDEYFRCDKCFYYFELQEMNDMDEHRRLYHKSHLTMLRSGFEPKCRICKNNFTDKDEFNSHLKQRHLKLQNQPLTKQINTNRLVIKHKYVCGECDQWFFSYNLAYKHCFEEHNTSKHRPIKRVLNNGGIREHIQSFTNQSVIPKSVVFKCCKCSLHYLMYAVAVQHSHQCKTRYHKAHKCEKCGKIFKTKNKRFHDYQHQITNDFQVITVSRDAKTYRTILCLCPKCGIHFWDSKFYSHFFLCTGPANINTYFCKTCKILMDAQQYGFHRQIHFEGKRDKSDFTVIEFIMVDDKLVGGNPLTNPITSADGIEAFKEESTDEDDNNSIVEPKQAKYKFYVCQKCKCCVVQTAIPVHKCGTPMMKCPECKLKISLKSMPKHTESHAKFPDMCRNNIALLKFNDNKPAIKEELSIEPAKKIKKKSTVKNKKPQQQKTVKYLALPEIVTNEKRLYQCNNCKTNYYRSHAKSTHICNKLPQKICEICDLSFTENGYLKHMSIHSSRYKLSKDNYEIIKFDCKTLDENNSETNSDCTKIYKCKCDLHFLNESSYEEHYTKCLAKKHILDVSKQKCGKCNLTFTPAVLFEHIMKNHKGTSEFRYKIVESSIRIEKTDVIYKCNSCQTYYLDIASLQQHTDMCKPNRKILKKCDKCSLRFEKPALQSHITKHHTKVHYSVSDFDIIDVKKSEVTNKIYRCAFCDLCFTRKGTLKHHFKYNDPLKKAVDCKICSLKFVFPHSILKHNLNHHIFNKYNIDDLSVVRIPDETKFKPENERTLIKCCKCNIHFLTKCELNMHLHRNHPNENTQNCSICNLKFQENSILYHQELHHDKFNLQVDDFKIRLIGKPENDSE